MRAVSWILGPENSPEELGHPAVTCESVVQDSQADSVSAKVVVVDVEVVVDDSSVAAVVEVVVDDSSTVFLSELQETA